MPARPEQVIEIPYRFDPWPFQEECFRAFYEDGIRRFLEIWPRRHGKDKTFLNLMVDQMTQRVGNYCHVFPQRNRARRIVWQGIDDDGLRYTDHFPPELIYRKSEVEMSVSLVHPDDTSTEGSIYWCLGSDKDEHLLVGTNPIGIIWSEYAEIPQRMRELALPILRRNHGWEAIVATPRGRNHLYRLYLQVHNDPLWHVTYLPRHLARDHTGTQIVSDADVEADVAAGMARETADQEYNLSWDSPMPGAYYAEEMRRVDTEGRIRDVPYDPALPVYTAWDLGHNDANAIWWVQPAGHELRVIDYEEASNRALVPPVEDVTQPSWIGTVRSRPYTYDQSKLQPPLTRTPYEVHYGPHDLEVHEYSTGKTRYGIALAGVTAPDGRELLKGLRFTVIPRGPIEDGIAAARSLLGRCVFDATRCQEGLDALRSYRREWDEKRQSFAAHPAHDWASNGADAWRYLAVGLQRPLEAQPPGPPPASFDHITKEYDRWLKTGRPMRSYVKAG